MPPKKSPTSLLLFPCISTSYWSLEILNTTSRLYNSTSSSKPSFLATITDQQKIFLSTKKHKIFYNHEVQLHSNTSNPSKGWTILAALSNFDIVVFCGWVIPHTIKAWDDRQSISIPPFTYSSIWKAMYFTSAFTY